MNWKKGVSIALTLLMVGGAAIPLQTPFMTYAESEVAPASEVSESSPSSSGGGESSSDSGSSSSGESSSQGGESSGNESSGNESSGSESSGSESSGSNESSDSSSGSESDDSGNEGSTSTGDSTSSDTTGSESSSEHHTEASKGETEKKEEDAEKKPPIKHYVDDDSNGRDYQSSEIYSSGNTYFTIVPVVRDEETITKQLNELKEKRNKLKKKKDTLKKQAPKLEKKVKKIEKFYSLLSESNLDNTSPEVLLVGCRKDQAFLIKPDRIEGLDDALETLALQFHDSELISWTKNYTMEYLPDSFAMKAEEKAEQDEDSVYSSAAPILIRMTEDVIKLQNKNSDKIDKITKQLKDIKEHIKNLEEQKAQNTIDLDSRLVDYKDSIPPQTVDFLNAVVKKAGCPYVWGADGPSTFDCSGLISYGLRQCKAVSSGFRWTSYDFVSQLHSVSFSEARPGDFVWKPGHIAVYIDSGTVFEAPYTGANVRFTSCSVSSRFSKVLRWWN